MCVSLDKRHANGEKRHACLFCEQLLFKLPRHLERCHEKEMEVARALSFPKKSKERKEAWVRVRNMGDYKYNVAIKPDDTPVVTRESKRKGNVQYVPCVNCKGFFDSRSLYKHVRLCKPESQVDCSVKAGRILLASSVSNDNTSTVNKYLLCNMRRDELHLIIRNDETLMKWAAMNIEKMQGIISSDFGYTLRCMAKLILNFRIVSKDEASSLKDVVKASSWDNLIEAMKVVCGYEEAGKTIATPSLIVKFGHALKSVAEFLRIRYLMENYESGLKEITNFLHLHESGWALYSNNAFRKMDEKKDNTPQELPLDSDIRKFRQFVVSQIKKISKKAEEEQNISQVTWRLLERYLLARVISFNAKRGSEPSRITLSIWQGVMDDKWKRDEDIENIQDAMERKLAESLKLCYLHGKRKRGKSARSLVPVLFTEDMVLWYINIK